MDLEQPFKTIICTLFEDHYHFGVAALTNSLCANGYSGSIYAGYRGKLPPWAKSLKKCDELDLFGSGGFEVNTKVKLFFVPVTTNYHLSNYKPNFMLQLLNIMPDSEAIFYMDPDIIVSNPWNEFEKWVSCGVALCEDVNSPLPQFHPLRNAWRSFYGRKGIELKFKEAIYANSGFVGIAKGNYSFLEKWKLLQEAMSEVIGGLNYSAFPGQTISQEAQNPFSPFGRPDQDALNAAVEAWNGCVSFVGQEAMGFKSGKSILPHAIGGPKPWHWKPLWLAVIAGRPPRLVDREFWNAASGPIVFYPRSKIKIRKLEINLAAFIGRFYHKY